MIALKLKQNQPTQQQDVATSGAWKRVTSDQKEISEIQIPQIKMKFPDAKNIMYFEVEVKPDDGFWQGGLIQFTIQAFEEYPIKPPQVLCKKRIFHPNIDLEGKVCLNILREDWKPVSSLKDILFGLILLFTSPNPTDPLNKQAAEVMLQDINKFKQIVTNTMKAGSYDGVSYDRII